ncbi:hypothetical protein Tco_0369283 [Tanacetum coccineum]
MLRRLAFAASVYHIWQERNKRLFSSQQRNWEIIINTIINTVRFKLAGLRLKKSFHVNEIAQEWSVVMNVKHDRGLILCEEVGLRNGWKS